MSYSLLLWSESFSLQNWNGEGKRCPWQSKIAILRIIPALGWHNVPETKSNLDHYYHSMKVSSYILLVNSAGDDSGTEKSGRESGLHNPMRTSLEARSRKKYRKCIVPTYQIFSKSRSFNEPFKWHVSEVDKTCRNVEQAAEILTRGRNIWTS